MIDYNDKLVELTDQCFLAEGDMRTAMDYQNRDEARALHTSTLATCKSSQSAIAAMDAYKKDTSLRDAVDTLLQAEISYLEKFGETIVYRDLEELTADQEETYTALENELYLIEQMIYTASENLITIQEIFAEQHGYELQD